MSSFALLAFISLWATCVADTFHEQLHKLDSSTSLIKDSSWGAVTDILNAATTQKVFPGAVALVGDKNGRLYTAVFGNYTDDGRDPPYTPVGDTSLNPTPTVDTTRFDMASCTKVVATTSAVALLYQRGFLELDDNVAKYLGAEYASQGKGNITLRNCLLHNAGYPPDPVPNYWDPSFGCFGAPLPEQLSFNCSSRIYLSLLNQTLDRPVNTKYVYSDLSFITLMFVIGRVVADHGLVSEADLLTQCGSVSVPVDAMGLQCFYEAFVRLHVFDVLGMSSSLFLPNEEDAGTCMPTGVPHGENVTVNGTVAVVQGRVNDGNAYMLGGIAGHAGLFSTASDVEILTRALLWPEDFMLEHTIGDEERLRTKQSMFLNSTTVKTFVTEYNNSQSSRALGWNTNDPTTPDRGWDLLCGNMSATTFTHTGYTGTQICADPEFGIYTILLTNRVYPNDTDFRIEDVRRAFNSAVVGIINKTHVSKSGEM